MFLLIDICTSKRNKYLLQRSIQDEQDLLELNAAKEKMVQNQSFFFFIVVVVFVTVMHSSPSCHALLTVMHLWLSCTFFSKRRILFRIDFQSSTFGYEKKSILNKILHIWWFLGILLLHFCPISDFFHHLECNTVTKTLPSLIFYAPYQSCNFGGLLTELRAKTWI